MKAVLIACVLLLSLANPAEGHRIVNTQNVAGGGEPRTADAQEEPVESAPATNRAEEAAVAQSPSWTKVEHRPIKAEGVGSNPTSGPSSAQPQPRLGRWRGFCSTWVYGEFLTPARWAADPAKAHRKIARLVSCVFDHIAPGNTSKALYVAERESHMYPWAQNVSSLCSGIMQHVLSAWPGRARFFLKRWEFAPWVWLPNWSDPRANLIVAAEMVKAGGWGPWGG